MTAPKYRNVLETLVSFLVAVAVIAIIPIAVASARSERVYYLAAAKTDPYFDDMKEMEFTTTLKSPTGLQPSDTTAEFEEKDFLTAPLQHNGITYNSVTPVAFTLDGETLSAYVKAAPAAEASEGITFRYTSTDNGASWSEPSKVSKVPAASQTISALREVERGKLSTDPAHRGSSRSGTIAVSSDNGTTWKYHRAFDNGNVTNAQILNLGKQKYALLWERKGEGTSTLHFATFNLKWLVQGVDLKYTSAEWRRYDVHPNGGFFQTRWAFNKDESLAINLNLTLSSFDQKNGLAFAACARPSEFTENAPEAAGCPVPLPEQYGDVFQLQKAQYGEGVHSASIDLRDFFRTGAPYDYGLYMNYTPTEEDAQRGYVDLKTLWNFYSINDDGTINANDLQFSVEAELGRLYVYVGEYNTGRPPANPSTSSSGSSVPGNFPTVEPLPDLTLTTIPGNFPTMDPLPDLTLSEVPTTYPTMDPLPDLTLTEVPTTYPTMDPLPDLTLTEVPTTYPTMDPLPDLTLTEVPTTYPTMDPLPDLTLTEVPTTYPTMDPLPDLTITYIPDDVLTQEPLGDLVITTEPKADSQTAGARPLPASGSSVDRLLYTAALITIIGGTFIAVSRKRAHS